MLKHQSRSSPVVSSTPHFSPYRYGRQPSPRTTTLPAPRRKSIVASPTLAPPRRQVHYVSRGTQWSPMTPKPAAAVDAPPLEEVKPSDISKSDEAQSTLPDAPNSQTVPSSPPKPVLEGESPSTRKRLPSESIPAVPSGQQDQALPARNVRLRPAQRPVKVLPLRYELCDVGDIVILISDMIGELIRTNDLRPLVQDSLTRFHSRTPPGISVRDYLQRLATHATLTPPLLLSMVYYIDRLCAMYPEFSVTTLTVHRFLITAATVAAKGLSDSFWNNATYAKVGGIKLGELGLLELDFLYRVDWKIVPNPEVLVDYYKGLVQRCDGYELGSAEATSEEEEDEDDELGDSDDSKLSKSPEATGAEAATHEKWQEWMDEKKNDGGHGVEKQEG